MTEWVEHSVVGLTAHHIILAQLLWTLVAAIAVPFVAILVGATTLSLIFAASPDLARQRLAASISHTLMIDRGVGIFICAASVGSLLLFHFQLLRTKDIPGLIYFAGAFVALMLGLSMMYSFRMSLILRELGRSNHDSEYGHFQTPNWIAGLGGVGLALLALYLWSLSGHSSLSTQAASSLIAPILSIGPWARLGTFVSLSFLLASVLALTRFEDRGLERIALSSAVGLAFFAFGQVVFLPSAALSTSVLLSAGVAIGSGLLASAGLVFQNRAVSLIATAIAVAALLGVDHFGLGISAHDHLVSIAQGGGH